MGFGDLREADFIDIRVSSSSPLPFGLAFRSQIQPKMLPEIQKTPIFLGVLAFNDRRPRLCSHKLRLKKVLQSGSYLKMPSLFGPQTAFTSTEHRSPAAMHRAPPTETSLVKKSAAQE
jgi:hypothetical protein